MNHKKTRTHGRHRKPRTRSPLPTVAGLAVLALAVLGACSTAEADDVPEPEVVTETVTETETVEVTPAVCIEALDAAERITHESTIPAFEAMSDAMYAAAAFDAAGIEAATVTINTLTDEMEPLIDDYNVAATACRALTEG